MQKFILIALALGLGFFLYLLQTDEIDKKDFNISKLQSEISFDIRKNNNIDSTVKSSDIYAIIKEKEYKVFTFSGNDFKKLLKAQYPQPMYKVPLEALSAVTGTWIGNRYVFYVIEKTDIDTNEKTYEIYKTEYPTDDISKLKYYLIKTVKDSDLNNKTEVRY